jgi:transposase
MWCGASPSAQGRAGEERPMAGTISPPVPTPAPVVGIDVSARWFDVARDAELRRFPNTGQGIVACVRWLGAAGAAMRVGLEATGTSSLPLATALHAAGHPVFVCNPVSLARYRQATLARTKTDKLDARCIARFCAAPALHPWAPTSAAHQRLHVLVATRQTLLEQAQQLRNRQHAAGSTACPDLLRELQAPVLAALAAQLAHLERERAALAAADTPIGEQVRLLVTIPGLGLVTAATLVASLPVERLPTATHAAAYVGLCPREKSSGVSVRGRSTIGSFGPAHLRRALYLPAIVAMHANPTLRPFAERLQAKGKPAKVVIVAVMRKLLLLAWTLLRTGRPFAAASSRPPEPSADADQTHSPVPWQATTRPAGT